VRAWQTHEFERPYAAAIESIRARPAPVVIVNERNIWQGVRLIRNDPFLEQRPLTLRYIALTDPQVRGVCARTPVSLFQASDAREFGLSTLPEPPDRQAAREGKVVRRLTRLGCRLVS
jgi:hypothetical protein